jgi:hypothetical protein
MRHFLEISVSPVSELFSLSSVSFNDFSKVSNSPLNIMYLLKHFLIFSFT